MTYLAETAGTATALLFTHHGQKILTNELQLEEGLNELELCLPSFRRGSYLLRSKANECGKNMKGLKY